MFYLCDFSVQNVHSIMNTKISWDCAVLPPLEIKLEQGTKVACMKSLLKNRTLLNMISLV